MEYPLDSSTSQNLQCFLRRGVCDLKLRALNDLLNGLRGVRGVREILRVRRRLEREGWTESLLILEGEGWTESLLILDCSSVFSRCSSCRCCNSWASFGLRAGRFSLSRSVSKLLLSSSIKLARFEIFLESVKNVREDSESPAGSGPVSCRPACDFGVRFGLREGLRRGGPNDFFPRRPAAFELTGDFKVNLAGAGGFAAGFRSRRRRWDVERFRAANGEFDTERSRLMSSKACLSCLIS